MNNPIEEIEVPEQVKLSLTDGIFVITGSQGEIQKTLSAPTIRIEIKDNLVRFFVTKKYTKREKKLINTFISLLNNYFKGVQEGHTYKLKVCSGHFPMSVTIKGNIFEVKNFIGENTARSLKIKPGATVKINGDEIVVDGIDLDLVSQTAADIERLTKRPGFDKRRFMDGIWITEKDGERL